MAGPRLVRGERPRGGRCGEVVVHAALGVRIGQRDHELAELALVADQPFAGQANRGRSLRQRNQLLAHDDSLELGEAPLVELEHLLRRHRVALERAQHLAVIRRRQVLVARQRRRHVAHLLAHFGEGGRAERDRLLRRDIDADAPQAIGIDLGRQCRRRPRARQDSALHPLAMRGELRGEALVRRLPALHRARAKQLRDAGDVALAVVELLLHFTAIRPEAPALGPLERARPGELGDGLRPGRDARIAAQPLERVLLARVGIALVEQHLQAFEHLARQVAVRHEQALLEQGRAPFARNRIEQDFQVLAHARIPLVQARGTQPRRHGAQRRVGALDAARLEIVHRGVVALEPELRHPLRREGAERLEQLVAVAIARLDPGAVLRRRHARRCRHHHRHDPAHHIPFFNICSASSPYLNAAACA